MRLLLVLLFSFGAWAQKENLNARDPRLNEGSLFTVHLVPGERKLTVKLAGKPGAELGPDRVVVLGREIRADGRMRDVTVRPSGSAFQIEAPADANSIELDVQDIVDKKRKETFRLDLR